MSGKRRSPTARTGVSPVRRLLTTALSAAATFAVGQSSSAPGQIAIEDLRALLGMIRPAVTGR